VTSNNWTAADLPDLSGRTVVVTGASSGLGVSTTRELARAGAHVVLAVRNVAKGEEVARTVEDRTEVRHLELTSLASIRGTTAVDSDVVLVVGPGDFALGHVVLSRVTHRGVITFSGGAGEFTWFHARIVVTLDPGIAFGWFWNGDYHFSPGEETKES
jgi:NADPH:quinone reductase-like Zn-dependent oxidoreductase